MRVRSQELFIVKSVDRARNDEDNYFENRDEDDELPDADSRAEAQTNALEEVLLSGLSLVAVGLIVVLALFLEVSGPDAFQIFVQVAGVLVLVQQRR